MRLSNAKSLAVAWEGNSDQALFVYADTQTSNTIRYFIYDRSDNAFTCPKNSQTVTALENAEGFNGPCNASNINSWNNNVGPIRLVADPRSSDIFLMAANGQTLDIQLEVLQWDGANNSFYMPTNGVPETDLSPGVFNTPQAHVFAFASDYLYAATLGNHASGQLTDQFDSAPTKDNVSLFRFQLVNTTAVDLTIDQVQFQLSAITGIVTSNLSDLRINNGTTDVATGGSPNISGETGTITFTGNFTLPASGTVNYTLIGDVISLAAGDTVTIGLSTANVTLLAGSLGGTAPTGVTHTTKWPRVSASADDAYVVDGTDDTTSYLASTLVTVRYNSTPANRRHGGFRIPGIYVPWVSTINSATLHVYVGDTYDDPPLDVYGHLTPNAPDFSTNTQIYARPPDHRDG